MGDKVMRRENQEEGDKKTNIQGCVCERKTETETKNVNIKEKKDKR